MNPDQTPTLHLNLDGNAEDNRNWSLIDSAVQRLIAQLGITGQGYAVVYVGATAPTPVSEGLVWWSTVDSTLRIYHGTTWVLASPAPAAQALYYLLAGAFAGIPTASLSLGIWMASLAFTLPAGLTGSQAHSKVAATASATCSLTVNGTAKGSVVWAAGAQSATFTFAAPVAINPGDIIELLAPATPDSTLSDLVWTVKGSI